ncbi:MAG: hypothetical protein HY459_01255 [Parcubacteria group bacterium]|nr:hypothetical protein [Parcubacteria group bacterium]
MELAEIKKRVHEPQATAILAGWSLAIGWIVLAIYWLLAFPLSGVIREYFLRSKAERDGAAVGSALLATLNQIQVTSAFLEPLKFVGIMFIITGIVFILLTILKTLKLRAAAMATLFSNRSR